MRCARRACYLPDSTYISDGNLAFDLGLLVLEIVGTTACLLVLIRRQRAWRATLRGAHLPSVRVFRR